MAVNSELLRDWLLNNGEYSLVNEGYRCKAHIDDKNRKLIVRDIECRQDGALDRLILVIGELGNRHEVNKITVFISSSMAPLFFDHGYRLEASIPRYYTDGQGMLIVSKFLSSGARREAVKPVGILIELGYGGIGASEEVGLPNGCDLEMGSPDDISGWHEFYKRVSDDYVASLSGKGWWAVVREGKDIVAAVCLTTDEQKNSAELAMFKSRKEAEERSYYGVLVKALTEKASADGIKCLYAIINSREVALNQVLVERGFSYRGQLVADVVWGREFADRYVWSLNL